MKKSRTLAVVFGSLLVGWSLAGVAPAQTNSGTNADIESGDDIDWSRHVVDAYRDSIQQQKLTLEMIDKARTDAAAAAATAKQNAAELEARLKRLEIIWAAQHERDMIAVQEAHRFAVQTVGVFAVGGVLALISLGFLLSRTMRRRVEQVTTALALRPAGALPATDTSLVPLTAVEQSNARFLNAIERLEDRIAEMEQEAGPATVMPEPPLSAATAAPEAEPDPVDLEVDALLGKAQAHLNLDQPQEALRCAEDALALAPDHAAAHVKRGSALEGLERVDEALAAYDKAIALDHSITMAYLRKGGVFNRLERYSEALQCYEQALKSQQKPSAVTQVGA